MGDVVSIHGQPAHLEKDELIEDLARFADNTLNEAAVKSRHRLSEEDWAAMGVSRSAARIFRQLCPVNVKYLVRL